MFESLRSLWKELSAGALLAALVLGLAFAAAPPDALAGWFGRHRHGSHDSERMRRHAEFATEFVLREVDATPEQTAQVKAIVAELVGEMAGVHDAHRARREALLAELSAPEISRAALQQLRADELALWETLSTRLVDGLVDALAVLTPEQRAELVAHAREHGGHGHDD